MKASRSRPSSRRVHKASLASNLVPQACASLPSQGGFKMAGRSRRSMYLRQVEIPRAEIEIDIDGAAIGQGGFGIVLLGQYKGAKVAVKQVSAGSMDLSLSCLRDEAKILVKLRSKFIVSLLGVVLEGGCSLVLEYMAQGNLLKFLQKWQTAIGWSLRGRLVLQVLKGMSYLHAHNIVHQDLKPENVLLDNGLNAKLSDFGTSVCKTWTQLTRMETQQRETAKRKLGMGTLAYMAPERLGSLNRKVDEKMDVYSFAILTWVILTNKEPYENVIGLIAYPELIAMLVTENQRPDLKEISKDCPWVFTCLMTKCWCNNPCERPSFKDCEINYEPTYEDQFKNGVAQEVRRIQRELGLHVEPEAAADEGAVTKSGTESGTESSDGGGGDGGGDGDPPGDASSPDHSQAKPMEPSVPVNAAAMAPEGTSHAPSVPSLLLTNPAAEEKPMEPSVPVNAAALAPEGTSHAPSVPSLLLTNPDNHKLGSIIHTSSVPEIALHTNNMIKHGKDNHKLGSIIHTSSVPDIALHTNNMIKHGKATNHPEKCYKVIHNFSSTSSSNQLSPSKSANDIATNHPERNYQVVHKYTSSSNKLSPSKSANAIATNHPERNYQVIHKYTSSSNQLSPSKSANDIDKITSNLTSLFPRGVPSQAGRVSPVPSRLGPFWGP
ncbi:uncharacterized protein LOC144736678 isoform X3 [Lampetra planeri]